MIKIMVGQFILYLDNLNQYESKTKIKSIHEKYDRYLVSKNKEESKLLNEKDVAMVDPIRYLSAQIQTFLSDILNKSVQMLVLIKSLDLQFWFINL